MSEAGQNRSHLEEISIRNLGVIENATIQFSPGLNVITGETGAGKTMLITALSLVLGGKSDSILIRKGSERLVVSGLFAIPGDTHSNLQHLIYEHDIEVEDQRLLFSRTVNSDGKSKAHISGIPTTTSVLSSLASELIEIHGQHGTLQLSKPAKQRELLDRFGGNEVAQALSKYQASLSILQSHRKRLVELSQSLKNRDREIADLKDLADESARLKPKRDELAEIEIEISKLESVEDIRQALALAQGVLDGDEGGVLSQLGLARRAMNSVREKDPLLGRLAEGLEESNITLAEIASELNSYLSDLAADPNKLNFLQGRRAALRAYIKRFGEVIGDLGELNSIIERAERARERIEDLSGGDEFVNSLKSELKSLEQVVINDSEILTQARISSAAKLDGAVTAELHELAMPKARFSCLVRPEIPKSQASEIDFGQYGNDQIEMTFSAHAGGELLPIAKAASGGELSRLMLAIEVVVSANSLKGTYLFDEVDAGVGGKAVLEVGRRLKRLSEHAQVIVVTHLPQVAIWADHHLRVLKDSSGSVTESSVSIVSGGERESEIARMLSGLEESEHAQEHARELLNLVKG